jgi:hypothetical protein
VRFARTPLAGYVSAKAAHARFFPFRADEVLAVRPLAAFPDRVDFHEQVNPEPSELFKRFGCDKPAKPVWVYHDIHACVLHALYMVGLAGVDLILDKVLPAGSAEKVLAR